MLVAKGLRSHRVQTLELPDWLQKLGIVFCGRFEWHDEFTGITHYAGIGDWIVYDGRDLRSYSDESYNELFGEVLTVAEYGERASATANIDYEGIRKRITDPVLLALAHHLVVLKNAALGVELIKKHLIYGKMVHIGPCYSFLNTERLIAAREWLKEDGNIKILHGILGLGGEAGETAELLTAYLFEGKVVGEELVKELGDPLWYVNEAHGIEEVAIANNEKLKSRYPKGFDAAKAINHTGT